ncbi:unnamed protein product [Peniophora sp. CBMAI 1063]|nr:unnamed protein product [Peniophora sp. CBMAI 1063]
MEVARGEGSVQSSYSRDSREDVTSLYSANPFSDEDEEETSIMSSFISRFKSTFNSPATSAISYPSITATVNATTPPPSARPTSPPIPRRPSNSATQSIESSRTSSSKQLAPLSMTSSNIAPPLISLTPVQSEAPSFDFPQDIPRSSSRNAAFMTPSVSEAAWDGGTSIPGFPIPDDARSIRTMTSVNGHFRRSDSVSKVIRRIRGEGLSREYWMDDENCKECYDCKSVFTAWRRKHHCRICGSIFCSRCASNIIKGYRFGHNGMIRVCNLCLDKLKTVEEDEDDDHDRHSISSSVVSTPFAAHQFGQSSSPFSASQLFGRADEPFNLFSIAETRRRQISGSDDSGFGSRPMTPDGYPNMHSSGGFKVVAPFRRAMGDDEGHDGPLASSYAHPMSPAGTRSKTPVDFPVSAPLGDGATSTIQFPQSSPERNTDSPGPFGRLRYDSVADWDTDTPFIRSRVQSRLVDLMTPDGGWRERRDSMAYAHELNLVSMFHLRLMLRQMLTREHIPDLHEWEETLLKLALQVAKELTFTAYPQRQGTDMDVRRYVKIKKVPGGAPRDSEYVDGMVITKNVAHKSMRLEERHPRIMLVTFPLEFSRVEGQYMHFGQIVRQEKEYLGNLTSRILALRPHVVLAEKSVSRLVLDALAKQRIAVARGVKHSAIEAVARMTQADILSSIDKLALEPRLGHAGSFVVKTFDHPLIPGRRKSYMRFEGCARELGCTIVLRGADLDTLRRVKKVTRFLMFIVRNLKLETHLWKDSVISFPHLTPDAVPPRYNPSAVDTEVPLAVAFARWINTPPSEIGSCAVIQVEDENDIENGDIPDEDREQLQLSRRIQRSLEPYLSTFISVSATLRFPPPYPIRRMKELDDELLRAKQAWEDEVVRREEQQDSHIHSREATVTPSANAFTSSSSMNMLKASGTFDCDDVHAQIESLRVPSIPHTPGSIPITPRPPSEPANDQPGYFDLRMPSSSGLSSTPALSPVSTMTATTSVPSTPAEETQFTLKTSDDIALESNLRFVKWQHAEQQRIWEWYLRKNKDDFVVEKYQFISMWEFKVPSPDQGQFPPCRPPALSYLTYYGEHDRTLGQFIAECIGEGLKYIVEQTVCEGKNCAYPMTRHCTSYVHNETRILVATEPWDGEIAGGSDTGLVGPSPELVTTWSACRLCGSATPFIPVSEEMQRYSFAKFLELHFYPADVQLVQGAGCEHNIYVHHIRYFAARGMTVRLQTDPVTLHEIVYPPRRVHVRPESLLALKNADYTRLAARNEMWYNALVDDLKLINMDAATGDEEHDSKLTAHVNLLISRAEAEQAEVTRLLNSTYAQSAPTDTLALNAVRSARQDMIVAWQADFDHLPKPRERDPRLTSKTRASTFGTMRAMWPRRNPGHEMSFYDSSTVPSSSVSEAEDGGHRVTSHLHRDTTGTSVGDSTFLSSASDMSDSESIGIKRDATLRRRHREEATTITDLQPAESPIAEEPQVQPSSSEIPKSDLEESDSTIGALNAARTGDYGVDHEALSPPDASLSMDNSTVQPEPPRRPGSRLPRRPSQQPSVAELVKKYQEYLPATGVEDLAKTALSPQLSGTVESDAESLYPSPRPPPSARNRMRHPAPRKASTSDADSSYATNIAPRYLAHTRRKNQQNSRIPAPPLPPPESQGPSRQPSPEKRPRPEGGPRDYGLRQQVPPPLKLTASKPGRPRDKSLSRPPSSAGPKGTFRRPSNVAPGKVSNIAKHFERINKDTERANRRYAVIRGRRARPVATARAKVEVLDSVKDAIRDESESSDSSEADDEGGDEDDARKDSPEKISPESSQTLPQVAVQPPSQGPSAAATPENQVQPLPGIDATLAPAAAIQSETPITSATPVPAVSPAVSPTTSPPLLPSMREHVPSDLDLGGAMGGSSIMKALSGFWPRDQVQARTRNDLDNEDPTIDPEHIFRDSSMVVRADEPTSIIALALNSPQYREMLTKSRAEKRLAREARIMSEGGEAFMPDDRSIAESSSTWGMVNMESRDVDDTANPTDDLRVPSSKLPWAITFESGGLTISCTVLYPEQFDALRRTYDCEKSMIESLARCVKWDSSGGKSGSAFLKTHDDRFIAKGMSRTEVQTMETFAPAYFDYMSSAVSADRPTLLAKVFGCYKITYKRNDDKDKKSGRAKVTQMNVIVMENLFYGRKFSKIYDLKGSTRNRHVQSTGRENEVLLDENLVQAAHMAPFYVREHSKRILRGALYNDSKFLADINVMDYSLVVGVDNHSNELVVGIVDYVRTYTWDKKLESWVKESALLGGGGRGEPTIVTPKQYRQRFIAAMERYFPLIPDRWMKEKDAPEEEGHAHLDLWPDW